MKRSELELREKLDKIQEKDKKRECRTARKCQFDHYLCTCVGGETTFMSLHF